MEDLNQKTPSYHPTYIYSSYFTMSTKAVVIGYNSSFDVVLCIMSEGKQRKQFIELSPYQFTNIALQSVQIQVDLQSEITRKKIYKIDEKKQFRLCMRKSSVVGVFDDKFRQEKILFSLDEVKVFLNLVECFTFLMQGLIFNQGRVMQFYQSYVASCAVNNTNRLFDRSRMGLELGTSTQLEQTPFVLDVNRLFYEIPSQMPYQLQRDIIFASVSLASTNINNQ